MCRTCGLTAGLTWRRITGLLGGKQGEFLSALLVNRLRREQWNGSFEGKAVVVPDEGSLPNPAGRRSEANPAVASLYHA